VILDDYSRAAAGYFSPLTLHRRRKLQEVLRRLPASSLRMGFYKRQRRVKSLVCFEAGLTRVAWAIKGIL
jgi:hypothetical protein